MINNFKDSNDASWVQLTFETILSSSTPLKSKNTILIPESDTNELSKVIFDFIFSEYQNNLFKKMKGSNFVFD